MTPGSSTLVLETDDLEGSYSITVRGTAGGIERTANLQLRVIVGKFDFEPLVRPKNVEVEQGNTQTLVTRATLISGDP